MNIYSLAILLILFFAILYIAGYRKAIKIVNGDVKTLHSLPSHYGWATGLESFVPGFVVLIIWILSEGFIIDQLLLSQLTEKLIGLNDFEINNILNEVKGQSFNPSEDAELLIYSEYYKSYSEKIAWAFFLTATALSAIMGISSLQRMTKKTKAQHKIETLIQYILAFFSAIAVFTTIGIVCSLLFESIRFFEQQSITEFVFGTQWSPQTAIRIDQVGSSGAFGAVPLFIGTMLITAIAMFIAAPIGLLSAIFMAEFANKNFRNYAKPLLELLAGIPTVVYGFIAALVVAPFIRDTGAFLGIEIASESALAAGIVMGIMIIPLISSLSDDVISVVPQNLRDGSSSLGATKTETVLNVVLPAALPGIVGALLLATSRAIGETMIVVMAAGMAANLTVNPLEAVTTVTVQIVALLTGDQEFASAKTLSAFALGLALFITTLVLNAIALFIVRKYREQYD